MPNNVGLEVIAYQGESDLFNAITKIIKQIKIAGLYDPASIVKSDLSAAIESFCGISTKITIEDSNTPNAMVQIPQLDKNHPIIHNTYRAWLNNDDLVKAKKFMDGKFTGFVSKKEARVYGAFSKLTVPIIITRGLLHADDFLDEEIAAVILHELGHVFSYFERIIDVMSFNYAAEAVSERILKTFRDEDSVELLLEYDKVFDVKLPDKETVAKSKNKDVVFTHIVSETIKQRRNEEGDEIYSYRGFEFSSDQFATRHGGGRYLVTALDKIYRRGWFNSSYSSWPCHIMCEIVKVTIFATFFPLLALANPFVGVLWVLVILCARPMNKTYDDPRERFDRVYREIVGELKNKSLTADRRNQVLSDLKVITAINESVSDKRSFFEAIWAYVIPSGNSSRKKMEFQQTLERLANNDLFVASAKFDSLGDK